MSLDLCITIHNEMKRAQPARKLYKLQTHGRGRQYAEYRRVNKKPVRTITSHGNMSNRKLWAWKESELGSSRESGADHSVYLVIL